MENGNHLSLFKGKSQTKSPSSPQMCPRYPSQTTASATGRPFQTLSMLCSQGACLELGGGRGTAVRRRLVCKSPLSSSPPVYALNGWCVLQTVCQGDRERWRGGALGVASPCYRAVTFVERHFQTVQPACPWLVSNGYLTSDFPLQPGFNLHVGTLVSTTQICQGAFC